MNAATAPPGADGATATSTSGSGASAAGADPLASLLAQVGCTARVGILIQRMFGICF